jgi:hypothetical protein
MLICMDRELRMSSTSGAHTVSVDDNLPKWSGHKDQSALLSDESDNQPALHRSIPTVGDTNPSQAVTQPHLPARVAGVYSPFLAPQTH